MALRDGVPAAMLDGHPRFTAHRLEPDIDLGRLILAEARQAPGERQPFARQPVADRADLPFRAIVEAHRGTTPVRLVLASDARPWIFQRLTHQVPAYQGVPIGDRVRIVDANESADYVVSADGRIEPR